jgi:hypothetical protein
MCAPKSLAILEPSRCKSSNVRQNVGLKLFSTRAFRQPLAVFGQRRFLIRVAGRRRLVLTRLDGRKPVSDYLRPVLIREFPSVGSVWRLTISIVSAAPKMQSAGKTPVHHAIVTSSGHSTSMLHHEGRRRLDPESEEVDGCKLYDNSGHVQSSLIGYSRHDIADRKAARRLA